MLTAFHHVALANLRHLHGDHEGALRRLTRLESRTGRFDVPLLQYETALVRARAYRALDRPGPCRREAAWALALATEHGWLTRARRVRDEFGLDAAPTGQTSATVVSARGASATLSLHQRRLHAVHQVSRAAATILDPDELARVTVGQIVEIFGAERAFLFLLDNGTVRPYLGRDSAGTELADLTGYGSTLVERVAGTGEPLVVTGSEEGAALGSRSVVVHGLRSIMIAPLLLKNRLVGVVYLDSRAARGIFTVDDLETLAELTNQVALALETARAAQLEVAVHAAQRERDLAETMRDLISELNTTLAPDEVAGRLTAVLGRVVPADRVVLLLHDNTGRLTVAGLATPGTHRAGGPATPAEVPADIDPATAAALDSGTPQRVSGAGHPQPMPHLLGPAVTTWMTIPLTVRDEHRGLLIVGGHEPYTEAHAEIAAALAAQATVALDNARLFNQVADLASRDALTGLANRRHFTAQAAHHLAGNRTVAAIMADIDHFKAVNDTHGHSVGDEVIREVGHRLSGCLRDSDIICRYGGEEFAILLPNITLTGADQVAARLHQTVTATPIDTQIGPLPVTVSVGVYTPTEPGEELHHLLTQADEALYEAKRGGRNQVVTRGPTQLLHNGCHQVAPLP
ncbi:MAG TPA: sensor domain-containing diguanylate cyclase [Rugosimonospora sp.]|nr:sensor domain-containing diguanylate cyclase [Rugosimonospora sp.]